MASSKDRNSSNLTRGVGLLGGISIGLGTMMGAGIFVLSAQATAEAGPGAALSFLLAGIVVLPIAMILSELVTALPREGGSYVMVSRIIGALPGGIVGPANWIGLIFATGFYLIGFAEYLNLLVEVPIWIVTTIIGLAFTALNYIGARITGLIEAWIVGLLLLLLLFFIVTGLPSISAEYHTPFLPEGWGAVVGTVGLIIVSFTGFEKVSTLAEEIREPMRNLPRAIIGSVLIAILVYVGVVLVMSGVMHYQEFAGAETPLVDAAQTFLGGTGAVIMGLGGLLATASSTNAAIMSSSRIALAMGRDQMVPRWFGFVHPGHHTPTNAILVTGGISTALALVGDVEMLAEVGSALFMISYALLALANIMVNRRRPDWYRPAFRVPLKPWLPAVAGIVSLAVILTMDTFSQVTGGALAIISLIWFMFWGRHRASIPDGG